MTAGLSEQLELSVLPECDRRMFCLINFVFFEISFKTTTQFVFDNSIPLRKNGPTTDYVFQNTGRAGLHFVPWQPGSGCHLNVVDCDASVTVPRLSFIPVLKWGSGGYPQPRRQT